MKKCDFLSPEALLQAEIFGDGNGGGSSSGIIDLSDAIAVNAGGGKSSSNIHFCVGYYGVPNGGLFAVSFQSTGVGADITLTSTTSLIFGTIISCSCSYSYSSNQGTISFSEYPSGDTITICGFIIDSGSR